MMNIERFTPAASSRAQLWKYQPDKKTRSWETAIENARDEIGELLRRLSSLKSQLDEALNIVWRRAAARNAAAHVWGAGSASDRRADNPQSEREYSSDLACHIANRRTVGK